MVLVCVGRDSPLWNFGENGVCAISLALGCQLCRGLLVFSGAAIDGAGLALVLFW